MQAKRPTLRKAPQPRNWRTSAGSYTLSIALHATAIACLYGAYQSISTPEPLTVVTEVRVEKPVTIPRWMENLDSREKLLSDAAHAWQENEPAEFTDIPPIALTAEHFKIEIPGSLQDETAGTQPTDATRNGGGGGENAPSLDLGHAAIEPGEFSKVKVEYRPSPPPIIMAKSSGDSQAAPTAGTLPSAGAGNGAGSGKDSGAAASSGSGTGGGAGEKGSGTGAGTVTVRRGPSQRAQPMWVHGGEYPLSARKAQIEGTVYVRVHIRLDGTVESWELARSSGSQDLDLTALGAAPSWRFIPAKLENGEAVADVRTVPIRYTLTGR